MSTDYAAGFFFFSSVVNRVFNLCLNADYFRNRLPFRDSLLRRDAPDGAEKNRENGEAQAKNSRRAPRAKFFRVDRIWFHHCSSFWRASCNPRVFSGFSKLSKNYCLSPAAVWSGLFRLIVPELFSVTLAVRSSESSTSGDCFVPSTASLRYFCT